MITLSCPDCGCEYSLENEMAGKQAACECGAILFVPSTPDVPEGMKLCNVCSRIISADSVICTQCGYNFETGGRIRDATSRIGVEEREISPFFNFLIKWWKPFLIIFVLLFSLVIVYNTFFVKKYGITDGQPLGTWSEWIDYLKQCKYQKLEGSDQNIPKIFGKNVKKIIFKDVNLEKRSKGIYSEKIFFIIDDDKNILAIGANFRGGVKTIPGDVGSLTGRIMSSLWQESGLTFPPPYKHFKIGKGVYATFHNTAKETKNKVSGEWVEYPSDVSIIPSSNTMLLVLSKFQNLKYDDFIGSFF